MNSKLINYKKGNTKSLPNVRCSVRNLTRRSVRNLIRHTTRFTVRNPVRHLLRTLIRKLIRNSAEDQVGKATEDVEGFDIYHGYGRVNAANAVRKALNLPLKSYQTEPGFMGDIKPFSFDYGHTISGTHGPDSEEEVIKVTVDAANAGRDMLAEIEVPLDHNSDNEFNRGRS